MRQANAKAYKRLAEVWCFEFLRDTFPEEVVDDMDRDELWNLAFPETHYQEVCRSNTKFNDDGEPEKYKRFRLFRRSPRWIYRQIKKNPLITKEELSRIP